MAALDIAERRLPQDGRISHAVRGEEVDFRVATVPTGHGESLVIRVLTCALHLLQSGVDIAVIALWLGHENIQTTQGYIEADLSIKEQALQKVVAAGQAAARF
jgi:type II secretory ATPase GspE/PulE/Tfp pilus assembly ATPase PilB-like protein